MKYFRSFSSVSIFVFFYSLSASLPSFTGNRTKSQRRSRFYVNRNERHEKRKNKPKNEKERERMAHKEFTRFHVTRAAFTENPKFFFSLYFSCLAYAQCSCLNASDVKVMLNKAIQIRLTETSSREKLRRKSWRKKWIEKLLRYRFFLLLFSFLAFHFIFRHKFDFCWHFPLFLYRWNYKMKRYTDCWLVAVCENIIDNASAAREREIEGNVAVPRNDVFWPEFFVVYFQWLK